MIRTYIILRLACASLLLYLLPSCQNNEGDVYIFSSFHEPSISGLMYLYSEDGFHWDTIPGVFMRPEIGIDTSHTDVFTGKDIEPKYYPGARILRDPSIVQGPDGTFHMVWTIQWHGAKGFGYASSRDLKNWSEQRVINVMQCHPTNNVWAPEIFYDDVRDQYLIIWSSEIAPERYTAADSLGTNVSQRLWYCITKDFETFTDASPYYDPGFNSIDGYLLKRTCNDYVLIVKDNRKPGFSNLFCAFSESPYGPFGNPTETFGRTYSEGPCAIQSGDEWIIYYDQYRSQEYAAVSTRDFQTFMPIPERISVPANHKHGTIIKVKRSILNGLLKNQHH